MKITELKKKQKKAVRSYFATVVSVLTEEHADTDGRSGAVISLCADDGYELVFKRKGTASEEDFERFEDNAAKKCLTLLDHPEHDLSFESADMKNGPYPGGARFPVTLVMAISGFAWQEDEVGVLWIGYKMGWIELNDALNLAKMSQGNSSLFTRLFGQFNRADELALAA